MKPDYSRFNPSTDGKNHINIYSRGRTELGRWLSHFQHHPIETEDGVFNSLEGYWYWLESYHDDLRLVSGIEAKTLGQRLRPSYAVGDIKPPDKTNKILKATKTKLDTMPSDIRDLFYANNLPFIHAYLHNGDYTIQSSMDGIIAYISQYRAINKLWRKK
uniref:Uncharacterized protein n=1 Tax=Serratia phage Kevin TaxID=3161161 RepID=A0AAU8KXR4_9CAUD